MRICVGARICACPCATGGGNRDGACPPLSGECDTVETTLRSWNRPRIPYFAKISQSAVFFPVAHAGDARLRARPVRREPLPPLPPSLKLSAQHDSSGPPAAPSSNKKCATAPRCPAAALPASQPRRAPPRPGRAVCRLRSRKNMLTGGGSSTRAILLEHIRENEFWNLSVQNTHSKKEGNFHGTQDRHQASSRAFCCPKQLTVDP